MVILPPRTKLNNSSQVPPVYRVIGNYCVYVITDLAVDTELATQSRYLLRCMQKDSNIIP
jgi:hypothetical protein